MLREHRSNIDFGTYWPRLLFLTVMSLVNSLLGAVERIRYGRRIEATSVRDDPVYILGHPRTGTTLLHSLLAVDEAQFTYCNTFCAGFPSSFLWFERLGKVLFAKVIDSHRPMDNVPLSFDLPQEDELATNVMSSGISPYMSIFLMRQEPAFRPYFAFSSRRDMHDDDDDDGRNDDYTNDDEYFDDPATMDDARKRWTDAFLLLLKKLTLRAALQDRSSRPGRRPRRLLLKSPVHTARIPLLLQLFPNAQFVYIHRHPYDVLRSALHMADTTYWYTYMDTPSQDQILEFVLRQYEILYERYEEGRRCLSSPSRQLVEVSYDELCADPVGTVRTIYEKLGWTVSQQLQDRLMREESFGTSTRSYVRNQHRPLPRYLKAIVNKRWRSSFERFGYDMDVVDSEEEDDDDDHNDEQTKKMK
jgi:LPS sulfotransferase NodH